MSKFAVYQFLDACRDDQRLLQAFSGRSLPEVLHHAKIRGWDFSVSELSTVTGDLEVNQIMNVSAEPIDANSSLWRKMWGRTHLEYVVKELWSNLSAADRQRLTTPQIHQLIFAKPKPGLSEEEFQRYWVSEHAPRFAAKIPQIRRYLIDTRIARSSDCGEPLFSGIAEIWLENEEQQLASLQTPEFLEGARRDEPNWAAFWATVVLDTDTHTLLPGPVLDAYPTWVKLVVLLKRREDLSVETFRKRSLEIQGPRFQKVPGLRRYIQCHVKQSWYRVGEPPFDAVAMYWFATLADLEHALADKTWIEAQSSEETIIDTQYRFSLVLREHWIIGPT